MMNLSTFFGSVHFAAFVLGAAFYLGYLMLPYLKHIIQHMGATLQRRQIEDCDGASSFAEQPPSKPIRKFTLRQAAFGGAVLSLLVAIALSTGVVDQVSTSCPADMEDSLRRFESANAAQNIQVKTSTLPTTLPSELLARASFIDRYDAPDDLLEVLNSCAQWTPVAGEAKSLVLASEMQAQLSCIDQLVDSGTVQLEASSALLSKSRNIIKDLRSRQDETAGTIPVSAKWARITHGIFQLTCNAAIGEITTSTQKMKTAKGSSLAAAVGPALAALHTLKRLETPFKETLQALSVEGQILEQPIGDSNRTEDLKLNIKDIQDAMGSDRTCAVRALQEGRSLALVLPKNAPLVKKMMICRPRMLETFEDFVVRSASQSRDAATRFGLGLYFSDIGLATGQGQERAPLFGKGPLSRSWSSSEVWDEDAEGLHAPGELVEAEALLTDGENKSTETDRDERAAQRALRLYQHAKMLALKHHDGAAEWRYKAAAKLASSIQRSKLAAHALGRLGYFLSLRGRKEEALEIIDQALKYGSDPLSQYLQASLRRSLGELKTTEDVLAAETQLSSVAGQLPSKLLEEQREAAYAQITWWRSVGTQGVQVCLKAWDAAQFLICMIAGLIFELPQAATKAIAEDAQ